VARADRDREKAAPKKVCCLVSEILEEAGVDRKKVRQIRRQILEGVILLCRWQLERMERAEAAPERGRKARSVPVD
jgi:hypothetical protein